MHKTSHSSYLPLLKLQRECYCLPVSFKTIRAYIESGFEIEELVKKKLLNAYYSLVPF